MTKAARSALVAECRELQQGALASELQQRSPWLELEKVLRAVPFGAFDHVVGEAGEAPAAPAGKTVVDATNALNPEMGLAVGLATSGAEERRPDRLQAVARLSV